VAFRDYITVEVERTTYRKLQQRSTRTFVRREDVDGCSTARADLYGDVSHERHGMADA